MREQFGADRVVPMYRGGLQRLLAMSGSRQINGLRLPNSNSVRCRSSENGTSFLNVASTQR